MVTEGDIAPDFSLPDDEGRPISLKQFRGKVILWFYVRDFTPG